MIAKRGMTISGLHFHSYPYTNMQAREKVEDLARILARYTGGLELYVVRVTHIQEAIHKHCPEEMMVTLLRRFMMRIAEHQAEACGAQCIITGESLGQVASQTIEGMTSSNAVVRTMPVLRPLVGFDKTEIVARARENAALDCHPPVRGLLHRLFAQAPAHPPRLAQGRAGGVASGYRCAARRGVRLARNGVHPLNAATIIKRKRKATAFLFSYIV